MGWKVKAGAAEPIHLPEHIRHFHRAKPGKNVRPDYIR
jgi:hypothetical protein